MTIEVPADRPPSGRAWRPTLLQAVTALLGLAMLARMAVALPRQSRLTNESGIWSALAIDYAKHGVLYRPIDGPLGFGGTRYFPLHVLAQGTLMRAGLGPVAAGYAIIFASAALLLGGMYGLMRRLDVPAGLAWPATILVTGTGAAEVALTTIRGDLLPAGLNVAGLAFVAAALGRRTRLAAVWSVLGGVLFALAFTAKVTTLFGLLAAVLALAFAGRTTLAVLTAVAFAAVAGPVLVAVQHASHGQFSANFAACATGGDLLWMVKFWPQTVYQVAIAGDPVGCALSVIGAGAFLGAPRSWWTSLPGLAVLATAAATAVLFVTPGIYVNHLIDLQVALVVFAAVAVSREPTGWRLGSGALAAVGLAAIGAGYLGFLGDLPRRNQTYRDILARATAPAAGPGPVLTDFVVFSVLQDRSPVVLDDFMLPIVAKRYPRVRADLYAAVDHGDFAAIIFKLDPAVDTRQRVWGKDFLAHLNGAYRPAFQEKTFVVYWRRSAPLPATRPSGP